MSMHLDPVMRWAGGVITRGFPPGHLSRQQRAEAYEALAAAYTIAADEVQGSLAHASEEDYRLYQHLCDMAFKTDKKARDLRAQEAQDQQ